MITITCDQSFNCPLTFKKTETHEQKFEKFTNTRMVRNVFYFVFFFGNLSFDSFLSESVCLYVGLSYYAIKQVRVILSFDILKCIL